RAECGIAEDLGVGMKAQHRAAPVLHRPGILYLAARRAAAVALSPQPTVARHLDFERVGQGIDHRDADAMQPASGLVDLAAELAARMQHRQDDLERRFLRDT